MTRVKFLEKSHQYFLEDRELVSVSKFVKQFEAYKDWYKIASNYAKKNGHTAEYWQDKWRDKGERSSAIGTIFHNIRENETINNDNYQFEGVVCARETCSHDGFAKWGIPINDLKPNTVYPELIVYDEDFMISGQIDKAIVTDTHIHIGDYKTDKVIEFKGYSSEWKKADKFKPPLDHLDDCNGNMYALKMSLYMYMLWKRNRHLVPGKLFIEHITLKRDEEGIPMLNEHGVPIVLDENIIELPYLKREVIDMLKYYRNKKR